MNGHTFQDEGVRSEYVGQVDKVLFPFTVPDSVIVTCYGGEGEQHEAGDANDYHQDQRDHQ